MDYQKTLEDVQNRRRDLLVKMFELHQQRDRIDEELAKLDVEVRALDQMRAVTEIAAGRREEPAPRVPGLTEHVRKVLSETQLPLTAIEIRDSCQRAGIKAISKRNLLMAVYTTLKRMHSEIKTSDRNGRQAFFPKAGFRATPDRRRRRT